MDFTNKNSWFEEYSLLLEGLGIEQEILILKPNPSLVRFAFENNITAIRPVAYFLRTLLQRPIKRPKGFILAHGYHPSVFATLTARFSSCRVIIVHHHQPNFFRFFRYRSWIKSSIHLFVSKVTYRYSFAIQAFSIEVSETLLNSGMPGKKIFLNPIGMNTDVLNKIYLKPESQKKNDGSYVIVSVSRLSWEKNLETAIRSVALAKNSGLNLKYQIYGEGSERVHLLNLIRQLGAEDYITLDGFDPRILQKIKAADLFLHTSFTESYGQVIFEAFALGTPILTTRVGVAVDLSHYEEESIEMILDLSPVEIAKQIRMLSARDRLQEFENHGLESLLEFHSIERSVLRLDHFLRLSL